MDINALNHSHPPLDYIAIAQAQKDDPDLSKLTSTSLQLQALPLLFSTGTILCDTTTKSPHPYIPATFRHLVFDQLHSLSHPGIRESQQLITERYVWPGMNRDICQWTKFCIACQRAKVTRHVVAPLGTFATPDACFDHIHLDLVGPLPPPQGYCYLLKCVDCYTRWPEEAPIPDITAETVARTLIAQWIFVFDVPTTITTDCGAQFEFSLFLPLQISLESSKYVRLHITLVPTAWFKDFINNSRPL